MKPNQAEDGVMETQGEWKGKEIGIGCPATTASYIWPALALFDIIWLSRLHLLISVCGAVPYQLRSYHICLYSGKKAEAAEIQ